MITCVNECDDRGMHYDVDVLMDGCVNEWMRGCSWNVRGMFVACLVNDG